MPRAARDLGTLAKVRQDLIDRAFNRERGDNEIRSPL
jgi:hypothetical protein